MDLWQQDIADSAHQLQRAAGQFQQRASGPRAVAALPPALSHLEEALERLATGVVKAAHALEDAAGDAGALGAEERALQWHLNHLSARLLGARDACPEPRRWARSLPQPETANGQPETANGSDASARPSRRRWRLRSTRRPFLPPRRETPVVVGFDGSPAASRALDMVGEALEPTTRVLVVAVEPDAPVAERRDDLDALLEAARDRLHDIDHSLQVETITGSGVPGRTLIEVARNRGAGLIAVGGRGEDIAARMLLGSSAAHVAQHADCDVLVVR